MSETVKYITAAKIKQKYGVSAQSLRSWSQEGKLRFVKIPDGNRLYDSRDIQALSGISPRPKIKSGVEASLFP